MKTWMDYRDLFNSGCYSEIIDDDPECAISLFPLAALIQLETYSRAILTAKTLLDKGVTDEWLIQLFLKALVLDTQLPIISKQLYYKDLAGYVRANFEILSQSLAYSIAMTGASLDLFGDAASIYLSFLSDAGDCILSEFDHCDVGNSTKFSSLSICVQTFASPEFTRKTLEAVARLILPPGIDCRIAIIQDGLPNDASQGLCRDHSETTEVIHSFEKQLQSRFKSYNLISSKSNRGPSRSCKYVLDHSMKESGYCLLIEDDCLLSSYALLALMSLIRQLDTITDEAIFGLESVFFNANEADKMLSPELIRDMVSYKAVSGGYIRLDYVPSTCFAISRNLWSRVGILRAFPEGPATLNKFIDQRSIPVYSPVLPYAVDIGASPHKTNSYTIRTEPQICHEKKKTYFMVDEWTNYEPGSDHRLYLYRELRDLFYSASCNGDTKAVKRLREILGDQV